MTEKFFAEIFGTAILILLGDGVVAGVLLAKSKAQNAGWIVITWAWGLAVFCGVVVAGPLSGAHLNPAVTLGLAVMEAMKTGSTGVTWAQVPPYFAGEFIGAMIGRFVFRKRFGDNWPRYRIVFAAGFTAGIGLITMLSLGVVFMKNSASVLPI